MTQKFSTYEFIANLIPGLAFIGGLQVIANLFGVPPLIRVTDSVGETSMLFAWSFLLGLIIQGIGQVTIEKLILLVSGGFPSARWLLESDPHFSTAYRSAIKKAVKECFQINVEPELPERATEKTKRALRIRKYQELFYLCYGLVEQKKLSDRPLAFNAHYGLFRASLTLSVLLLLLTVIIGIMRWDTVVASQSQASFVAWLSLLTGIGIVAFVRMIKRGEDFAKSVYDLFYVYWSERNVKSSVD